MNENTENTDDFFMGLIFWLIAGLANLSFIYYFVTDVSLYHIQQTNEEITNEWRYHDSSR
jgi:hypothetical protein